MTYYQSLCENLYGTNVIDGSIDASHSPNNIRFLVLDPEFILSVLHVSADGRGLVRYTKCDPASTMDYYRLSRGNICNVLLSRQLNCMEGFYVRDALMGNPKFFSMEYFLANLLGTGNANEEPKISRLREVGVISNQNYYGEILCNDIKNALNSDHRYEFLLSMDPNLQFVNRIAIANSEWYKKFALRNEYSLDTKLLVKYFQGVRKTLDSSVGTNKREKELAGYLMSNRDKLRHCAFCKLFNKVYTTWGSGYIGLNGKSSFIKNVIEPADINYAIHVEKDPENPNAWSSIKQNVGAFLEGIGFDKEDPYTSVLKYSLVFPCGSFDAYKGKKDSWMRCSPYDEVISNFNKVSKKEQELFLVAAKDKGSLGIKSLKDFVDMVGSRLERDIITENIILNMYGMNRDFFDSVAKRLINRKVGE